MLILSQPARADVETRAENCGKGFCSEARATDGGFGSSASTGVAASAERPPPLLTMGGEAFCFGERLSGRDTCDPATPPSALPSDSAEEAFTRVSLPEPALDITPRRYGVTQHPTTITVTAAAPFSDEAPFGGSRLLLRATPTSSWTSFGEGAPSTAFTSSHAWQQTGCYLLRVQVTWQGEWSLDGETWTAIGTRTTRREVEYPVAQVVGVLQSSDEPTDDDPERVHADYCAPGQPRASTPWP